MAMHSVRIRGTDGTQIKAPTVCVGEVRVGSQGENCVRVLIGTIPGMLEGCMFRCSCHPWVAGSNSAGGTALRRTSLVRQHPRQFVGGCFVSFFSPL